MLCDDGEIELNTPRDRENTFESQLIKKNQTRITQMDSQILSLYAKGMTTREIVATFSGIVHFCDAAWIASHTTFFTESSVGNTFRFLVACRITLFSDSMAFVV